MSASKVAPFVLKKWQGNSMEKKEITLPLSHLINKEREKIMKKILITTLALSGLLFTYQISHASLLVADIDTSDLLTQFSSDVNGGDNWTGNDENPMDLDRANPVAEENWLEALNGLVYNDPNINYFQYSEAASGLKILNNYNPGFSWEYAVVKAGNTSYAFYDNDLTDLLSYDFGQNGISHISYFNGNPIPEPATMLLFGVGLAGLAGIARRKVQ